ncbi:MAG: phosphonate C-P lyase system protein PhnG [Proteobacteria bacterium]|nr:phosphonate C-P lyase system protein PhnG [Pseudomonadota bacterium]MBU1232991.1 phosphonate C-P lyase system protein PhnG [Pseudomonadota bacterium]MBU1418746.1 phosphonate C-P lyase system protein PhnG [Pseudomonadota bacterium]MBU1455490.1 phosphonate C-P lyase system protein PhnG [Pseudomonadota bacterium]
MNREELNFYLQQADLRGVADLSHRIEAEQQVLLIQKPMAQTLLLPVQDPVASGSFYGGEILVTSVIVRVNGCDGWAMVMDEEEDLAFHIAVLDGAWAAGLERSAIEQLAWQGRVGHEQRCREQAAEIDKTRVSFDLM